MSLSESHSTFIGTPSGLLGEIHRKSLERKQRLGDGVFSKYAQAAHKLSEAEAQLSATMRRIAEAQALLERTRNEAAVEVAANSRPKPTTRAVTIRQIVNHTAHHFSMSEMEIIGNRRQKHIVYARQVVMFLAKHLTALSFPQIGQKIGGKDHATVLHGARKIENLLEFDPELRADVAKIKESLFGNVAVSA